MLRRLFFFIPDEYYANSIADQLVEIEISKPYSRIMALADGRAVVPEITKKFAAESYKTKKYKTTVLIHGQSILWNCNLLLFAFAMIAFLITLAIGEWYWIIAAFAIMATSFYVGERFFVEVPDVPLTELTEASVLGEALLMVDVPGERVAEVKNFIRHHHPEAIVGRDC